MPGTCQNSCQLPTEKTIWLSHGGFAKTPAVSDAGLADLFAPVCPFVIVHYASVVKNYLRNLLRQLLQTT